MSDLPSLSSGPVGSRFVSQNDIDHARARRDEQWKAAYARLGQEPPPQPKEDAYDGRSLAEKLAANRAAKQEEWEEKNKLANQFRALEEDEIMFLDSVRERQEQAERDRKLRDGEELKSFREAVANKVIVKSPPPAPTSSKDKEAAAAPPSASSSSGSKPTTITPAPAPPVTKKAAKPSLKGVLVKKKTKDTSKPAPKSTSKEESGEKRDGGRGEEDGAPDPKRRKVSSA